MLRIFFHIEEGRFLTFKPNPFKIPRGILEDFDAIKG